MLSVTLRCDFSNIRFPEEHSSWIFLLLGPLSVSVVSVYCVSSWDLAPGSTIEEYLKLKKIIIIRIISQCDVYSGLKINVTRIVSLAHSEAPRNITQMSGRATQHPP